LSSSRGQCRGVGRSRTSRLREKAGGYSTGTPDRESDRKREVESVGVKGTSSKGHDPKQNRRKGLERGGKLKERPANNCRTGGKKGGARKVLGTDRTRGTGAPKKVA